MSIKQESWKKTAINVPGQAPSPLGTYSHAIKAGPFIYLSGQGARDPKTGQEAGVTLDEQEAVLSYDIEVQTHAVIRNLQAVLKASGCSLKDVIDVSVFLSDIQDFQKFNQVYAQYFGFEGAPARTTVQAAALPGKNFIEIKAVALAPES